MITFTEDGYFPFLKWKFGELAAVSEIAGFAANRVTPLFVVPPAGEHDPEEKRPLTPTEHIRSFGPRLAKSRGKRLAFVDAEYVDDERHAKDLSRHPLTELLERARLSGAMASPITGLSRAPEYQRAVARFIASDPNQPVCLRLTLSDLMEGAIAVRLRELLTKTGAAPSKTLIIIDLGFYGGHDPAGLIDNLVRDISALPFRDDWRALALTASSFPETIGGVRV